MRSCSSSDLLNGKSFLLLPTLNNANRFSFFHTDTSLVSSWTTQKYHNAKTFGKTFGKKLRKSPVVCLPPSGILDDVIGVGHIDFRLRLGPLLCRIALWGCFGEAIASLIGYFEVAQETWSQFIPQNVPWCNSTQQGA